jgi:hypothetical protein
VVGRPSQQRTRRQQGAQDLAWREWQVSGVALFGHVSLACEGRVSGSWKEPDGWQRCISAMMHERRFCLCVCQRPHCAPVCSARNVGFGLKCAAVAAISYRCSVWAD